MPGFGGELEVFQDGGSWTPVSLRLMGAAGWLGGDPVSVRAAESQEGGWEERRGCW